MSIAPELSQLLVSLADLALKNTAGAINTRIKAIRAGKQQAEVINELVDIVNELVDGRNQLIGIARGLEEALVAQRITDEEIRYITERLIPTFEQLVETTGDTSAPEFIEPLKAVLSTETLTILQLVGFNFKAAIGEPLTQLMQHLILPKVPDADTSGALALLSARREVAYLEVVQDADAFDRLREIQ